MKKKALWKEIHTCFSKSKGRFFSILCLVALGSFALVGLQVAGPDMRQTGESYFEQLKVADISVIGDYGIDADNVAAIDRVSGADKIAYGYLKDVVLADTTTSIRIFSATEGISEYEVVRGRMPKTSDEIAVAADLADQYQLNDILSVTEKEDITGSTVLRHHDFRIVGFVNSGELLSSINMGQSTAGTGELQGYAVVTPTAFDSDVYMIARLSFTDTKGISPYSDEYTRLITAHKEELNRLLADQPSTRLAAIQTQYQEKIDQAQAKIDKSKKELADTEKKLTDSEKQLNTAKKTYQENLDAYNSQAAQAKQKFAAAQKQLTDGQKQIEQAESQYTTKKAQLEQAERQLAAARRKLDKNWADYNKKAAQIEELRRQKAQLTAAQKELDKEIAAAEASTGMTIDQIAASLPILQKTLPADQYKQLQELVTSKKQLEAKWAAYNAAAKQAQGAEEELAAAKKQLDQGEADYAAKEKEVQSAKTQITAAGRTLNQKKAQLKSAQADYDREKAAADEKLAAAKAQLTAAQKKISAGERELKAGQEEFSRKAPEARQKISDAEEKVASARRALNSLKQPVYAMDTRREIPGSEGYRIYGSISNIVDSLAGIFPIFLYFVAALVTLTTMTRFVDEERLNAGTLKALGYDNRDIMKKFTLYGLSAGMSGALLGIIGGHTLLPLIVYNAYGKSFTYPKIELHFYPGITAISLALAFLCTVVPAFVVAQRELKERPAALLQPKPPVAGSKILLERITPVWNRMNFTHKVTARNIFRYKKRMLMTIFGVCGSVALIFAGLSVQNSVAGIKDLQFNHIMRYDLIVAETDDPDDSQKADIDALLKDGQVKSQTAIYYETVTKTAGKNNDSQEIKLIVPEDQDQLSTYITLRNRSTGQAITLSDDGCVISERLAKLLGVQVGDTITFDDATKTPRTAKVTAITEMYTGHFIFMNRAGYQSVFGQTYCPNAHLVTLLNRSAENAQAQAARFIDLSGVKGVVQNTTLTNQIDTIVHSLHQIMQILIFVAMLLTAVILYNLTNINVCERIRELSTVKVLGFYDKEVTLYIYRETLLLTVIGTLVGYGFGDALYRYIITVVPPEDVMFNPALGPKAFLIPALVIAAITAFLGWRVHRRLKNVDMLEALKSVE